MNQSVRSFDYNMLICLADFRTLLLKQIAILEEAQLRTVRRRMMHLVQSGFVEQTVRRLCGISGRPEHIFSLSPQGVSFLRSEGVIKKSRPPHGAIRKIHRNLEHHLSLNWCLISVLLIQRFTSLEVQCFSPTSLLHDESSFRIPFLKDSWRKIQQGEPQENVFYPDGIFVLHHPVKNKSLLFFLEVDRATMPLFRRHSDAASIARKFMTYYNYLMSGGYKRYEEVFSTPLNGFRLLMVSHADKRLAALCELARCYDFSDFLWFTEESNLFDKGMSAPIWVRGGRMENPRQSILGSEPAPPISIQELLKRGDQTAEKSE